MAPLAGRLLAQRAQMDARDVLKEAACGQQSGCQLQGAFVKKSAGGWLQLPSVRPKSPNGKTTQPRSMTSALHCLTQVWV